MSKSNHELKRAGAPHAIAAWIFLAGALIAGIVGVFRTMSGGVDRPAAGGECFCLALLLALIAAVFALLGIHRQNAVLYDVIGPGYQGSHGSGDDDGGDV
jgi:hypothetical protein